MKKIITLPIALILVFSLAACGGKNDPQTSGNDEPRTSQQTRQPGNTPDNSQPSGAVMNDWGHDDYVKYTDGVPEPEFTYTNSGIIGEAFTFKSEAPADEINAWKQTLLDNGAEEVREGDTWAVIDGAHLIEMNGITNGVAYFYISLDDRPVGGGQPEQYTPAPNTDGGNTEIDESRTLQLYRDYFSGEYTLKVETYKKFFDEPDRKEVDNTTLMVIGDNRSYTEITSAANPSVQTVFLIMDDYEYMVDDSLKMILRTPARTRHGTTLVVDEEGFYTDLVGKTETVEIFGEKYESEHFSGYAESISYCYDGDKLKYIISENGGVKIINGVLELTAGADCSYFELPEDYEKNY